MLGSAGVLLLFYGQLAAIFTIASLAAFLLDQRLQRLLRRWDKAKQVPALA